jgi:hypothetical protein
MEERAWFDFSLKIDGSWSSSVSMIDIMTQACEALSPHKHKQLL